MAYTQTDLDNIRELIAAGEGETFIDGKKVVYRSLDELERIESRILRALAETATPNRRPRRGVRVNVCKGL
jgi:hypothetical protein